MDSQPTVLIVDRSDETLEVLQTALERRGLRTFAATAADRGLALARQHRPDLIVLDLEWTIRRPRLFRPLLPPMPAPTAPRWSCWAAPAATVSALPDGEFVAKPYHYGPLIRKIEELVKRRRIGMRDEGSEIGDKSERTCQSGSPSSGMGPSEGRRAGEPHPLPRSSSAC